MMKHLTLLALLTGWISFALAQDTIVAEKDYFVRDIQVRGARFSSPDAIRTLSGLQAGWTVLSGPAIPDALRRLWQGRIFADLQISAELLGQDSARLWIEVKESVRLSSYAITGVNKSQRDALKESLNLVPGTHFSPAQEKSIRRMVRHYFMNKGYYHTEVSLEVKPDPLLPQRVNLQIEVAKGRKTRIAAIEIEGNEQLSDQSLKKALKPLREHRWWKVWAPSKMIPAEYDQAKSQLLATYQENGFQDVRIIADSIWEDDKRNLVLSLQLHEGNPYYIRQIHWSGNQMYSSEQLHQILNLEPGNRYSPQVLERRLYGGDNGLDIASLYLDQGHLFFHAQPVVSAVAGDSVEIEIRIWEGQPAWVRSVKLTGNKVTADHVILRELETQPGDVFSRTAIMRSQRKLMALNYFAPDGFNVVPHTDPKTGAVDLEYQLKEQSTDRFQLSGGWGARIFDSDDNQIGGGFTGTLQLNFNNFSTKRFFQKEAWRPVPSGDGQQFSLAVQSNGGSYTNFAISFQEPWLGGKKPNFFGFSARYELFNALFNSGDQVNDPFQSRTFSVSTDFGTRMPFDVFTRYYVSLGYRYYDLENPGKFYPVFEEEEKAYVNALTLTQELRRNNLDHPVFPTSGMDLSLSVSLTPPFSLFQTDREPATESAREKYKLLEFHKWQFKGDYYKPVWDKLVLRLHGEAGYVGAYNSAMGISPFERFAMGGYGILANANGGFMGLDLVPLRGYASQAFNNGEENFPLYHRYAVELRYPINIGGQFPVWMLGFAEAGNAYTNLQAFKPLELKRAAGLGFRTQLPMIGLFGIDWGYGFDVPEGATQKSGHQFHFILGREF
jgi:outer membrane protein insertion porin family